MPLTVDEYPHLFTQAVKLFAQIKESAAAIKALPSPTTVAAVATALKIGTDSPLYTAAETIDLVVKDLKD